MKKEVREYRDKVLKVIREREKLLRMFRRDLHITEQAFDTACAEVALLVELKRDIKAIT